VSALVTITQTDPMAVLFAVPEIHVPLIQHKLRSGQVLPVQVWDREAKQMLAQGRVSSTDNAIDLATGTLRLKAKGTGPNQQAVYAQAAWFSHVEGDAVRLVHLVVYHSTLSGFQNEPQTAPFFESVKLP
jgi:multidrug efflux pump subunit AcrA (membrane-fusion protein)